MANIIYRSENIQIIFLWIEEEEKKRLTQHCQEIPTPTKFHLSHNNTEKNGIAPDSYACVRVCLCGV